MADTFGAPPEVGRVLAPFAGEDYIPLPSLARSIKSELGVDWSREARSRAVVSGLIEVAPTRGRDQAHQVTPDEARRLALGVLLALAAGVAILTALQVLKGGAAAGLLGAAAEAATGA